MTQQEKYLIRRLRQGDRQAFNALYNVYANALKDFVLLLTKDQFCANEVVSEVFTQIWENRRKLHIRKNLAAYLYKTAKNILASKLRQKNKSLLVELNENIDQPYEHTPERQLIEQEEHNKVQRLLDLIPPKSREIFIMHKYDKLKYKEIAQLLGISVKTVENHIAKAMKILRDYYLNQSNSAH